MKLYRYRPLSEFLFKELFYQEIFLANFAELNDPLDLNPILNFKTENSKDIRKLILFILELSIRKLYSAGHPEKAGPFIKIQKNRKAIDSLTSLLFEKILNLSKEKEIVSINDIIEALANLEETSTIEVKFETDILQSQISALTQNFLQTGYAACFSEVNDNYLMWSHYASKHSGICLEFDVYKNSNGQYLFTTEKKWHAPEPFAFELYDDIELISKVEYKSKRNFANFFDFINLFKYKDEDFPLPENESLPYREKIGALFHSKIDEWSYEKEWRILYVSLNKFFYPEQRIINYSLSGIKSIYFGYRTPTEVKERIINIFYEKQSEVRFYDASIAGTGKIKFEERKSLFEIGYDLLPKK